MIITLFFCSLSTLFPLPPVFSHEPGTEMDAPQAGELSTMESNELAAVRTLRTISVAQTMFKRNQDRYAKTVLELFENGDISDTTLRDAEGTPENAKGKNGYVFTIQWGDADQYLILALPMAWGTSGQRALMMGTPDFNLMSLEDPASLKTCTDHANTLKAPWKPFDASELDERHREADRRQRENLMKEKLESLPTDQAENAKKSQEALRQSRLAVNRTAALAVLRTLSTAQIMFYRNQNRHATSIKEIKESEIITDTSILKSDRIANPKAKPKDGYFFSIVTSRSNYAIIAIPEDPEQPSYMMMVDGNVKILPPGTAVDTSSFESIKSAAWQDMTER